MAVAKWQQANGAKRSKNGRPKTVRNRQPKKCENERKSTKTSENRLKSAKTIGVLFGDRVFGPFSSATWVFPSRGSTLRSICCAGGSFGTSDKAA